MDRVLLFTPVFFFFFSHFYFHIDLWVHSFSTNQQNKNGGGGGAQYPIQFMIATACLSAHIQGNMNKCETKSNASKRYIKVFIPVQVAILH